MRFIRRNSQNSQSIVNALASELKIPEILASLIVSRGITDPFEAARFLNPCKDDLHDPFLFDAMEGAVELIKEMIDAEVPIAVYSDFDCDGVCGAAILKNTLERLGAEVRVYIPDRFTEGYGTNANAIEMLTEDAGLIITVDCGITSVDDVALARDMGAEVIILDHHECGELPDTPYIINPKRPGESYPDKFLCGAGIAFKLSQALLGDAAFDCIDIAGMATIGDIVSLMGENRVIAALGIDKIRTAPCEGIRQLCLKAGVDNKKINSYIMSFRLVPRINVAGRLEHAYKALDLLCAEDAKTAAKCAEYLNDLNEQRRTIQHSITELAREQVLASAKKDDVIMVRGNDFHRGVVGLAASALASHFNRPTIVLSEENGVLTGSARSIEGVNIHEIMSAASEHYIKFGGHSQAAGVTMDESVFEEVRAILNDYAQTHVPREAYLPFMVYDEELMPYEATEELACLLESLEPFGQDNPMPVFIMRDIRIKDSVKMGRNFEHTRAKTDDLRLVRFGGELENDGIYTVSGTLGINEYADNRTVQFVVDGCEKRSDRETKYIRGFLKEACALEAGADTNDIDKFISDFSSDKSACVLAVCTKAGEIIADEKLPICEAFDDQAPKTPCKCVVYNLKSVPEWCEKLYLLASPSLKIKNSNAVLFMDEMSRNSIMREMAEYFVPEDMLLAYFEAFKKTNGKYDTISLLLADAAKHTGGTIKDMWFALNVFFEQKLIAFAKGDKISLIYKKGEIAAENSVVYRSFKKILMGGTV